MPQPKKQKQKRSVKGEEYRLKIDAFTPKTIPMARLAEYMQALAQMLGEPTSVHFERLATGSTAIVHRVEHEAIPKVQDRISNVRRGEAPSEALRASKTINRLLCDDNAVGHLIKRSAIVIRFPGKDAAEERFSVRQQGAIDGIIIRVGGADATAHVVLEAEGKPVTGCDTTREIAKQLGNKLYESVRLFGRGRWSRDSEGIWALQNFKIESFEPLDGTSLTEAITDLRAIPSEWDDDAIKELAVIRHGPVGKRNGSH